MDLESYILAKEYVDEAIDFEIGKFLSLWDCSTGSPISFPETIPYTYTTGDYFIVGEIGNTNFKPSGSSYTGSASFVEETGTVSVQDVFVYDGAVWLLFSQSDSKLGQKMDKINAKGIGSFSINGIAEGENSVAIGEGTVAGSQGQQVSGKYNVIDDDNTYLQIVGNGTNEDNRSNAYTLDQNGNAQFAGDVTGNKNGQEHKLSNKQNTLVSGTNIKTVDGESILGGGNLNLTGQLKIDLMLSGILARNSASLTGDISSNVVEVAELEGMNDTAMYTTSLSLPNAVNIGRYSFFNTRNLRNLNAPKVTTIGAYAFQYLGYNVNEGDLEVDLPELKTTGYQAFFINRVTRINVPKLESVNFGAFWRSFRLQTIDLPVVTSLASKAFSNCTDLAEITLGSNSVVTLGNIDAFESTPYDANGTGGIIYVPQALIESYKVAPNWDTLFAYGNCEFRAIEE